MSVLKDLRLFYDINFDYIEPLSSETSIYRLSSNINIIQLITPLTNQLAKLVAIKLANGDYLPSIGMEYVGQEEVTWYNEAMELETSMWNVWNYKLTQTDTSSVSVFSASELTISFIEIELVANIKFVGTFADQATLEAAIPVGTTGQYATVTSTETSWLWSDVVEAWQDGGVLLSEYLTKVTGTSQQVVLSVKPNTFSEPQEVEITATEIIYDRLQKLEASDLAQDAEIILKLYKHFVNNYLALPSAENTDVFIVNDVAGNPFYATSGQVLDIINALSRAGGTMTGTINALDIIINAANSLLATTIKLRENSKIQNEDGSAYISYGVQSLQTIWTMLADHIILSAGKSVTLSGVEAVYINSDGNIEITTNGKTLLLNSSDGKLYYDGNEIYNTENVEALGFPTLPVSYLQFALNVIAPTHGVGRMFWDDVKGQLAFYVENSNTVVNPGYETVAPVVNKSGGWFINGTIVYPIGYSTDLNGKKAFEIGLADSQFKDRATQIALLTQDLNDEESGNATIFGLADGIDLLALGFTIVGEPIYLGSLGLMTPTRPINGHFATIVGFVAEIGTPGNSDGVVQVDINRSELTVEINDTNGFPLDQRFNLGISNNDALREHTVTALGLYHYYELGLKYEETASITKPFDDVEGIHAVYFSNGVLTIANSLNEADFENIVLNKAFVDAFYWNVDEQKTEFILDERHGISMSPATHLRLHEGDGTLFRSGMGITISNIDVANPTDDTAVEITIASGVNKDEDIVHQITEKLLTGNIREYAFIGINKLRMQSENQYGISNENSGERMSYNLKFAGEYIVTEAPDNSYLFRTIVAVPDVDKTRTNYFSFLGYQVYGSQALAEAGAADEISILITLFNGLVAEFTIVGQILYQTKSSYANTYSAGIRSVTDGDFIDYRAEQIKGTGALVQNHNDLAGRNNPDQHTTNAITEISTRNFYTAGQSQDQVNELLDEEIKLNKDKITNIQEDLVENATPEKWYAGMSGKYALDENGIAVVISGANNNVPINDYKGGTLNQVIIDGDVSSALTSDGNSTVFSIENDGTITFGTAYSATKQTFNIISGNTYFARITLDNTSVGGINNLIRFRYSTDVNDTFLGTIQSGNIVYGIITASTSLLANLQFQEGTAGLFTKDEIMLIPIDNTFLDGLTADEINDRLEYFESLQSVGSPVDLDQLLDNRNDFGNWTDVANTENVNDIPYIEKLYSANPRMTFTIPVGTYTILAHIKDNTLDDNIYITGGGLGSSNITIAIKDVSNNDINILKKVSFVSTGGAYFEINDSGATQGSAKVKFILLEGDHTNITDEQALKWIQNEEFGVFTVKGINIESIGKQKLPDVKDWEQGSFDISDNLVDATNRIRSKTLIPILYGTTYVFSTIGSYTFSVNELDSQGNLVNSYGLITVDATYTPTDSSVTQLRISLRRLDNADLETSELITAEAMLEIKSALPATDYADFIKANAHINEEFGDLPDGTADDFDFVKTKEYILTEDDITAFANLTNVQRIIIEPNLSDNLDWTDFIDGFTRLGDYWEIINNSAVYNVVGIHNAYATRSSQDIAHIVELGTYADLTAAKAGLVGTKLRYKLATPLPRDGIKADLLDVTGKLLTSVDATFTHKSTSGITNVFSAKQPFNINDEIQVIKDNDHAQEVAIVKADNSIEDILKRLGIIEEDIVYSNPVPSLHVSLDTYGFRNELEQNDKIRIYFGETVGGVPIRYIDVVYQVGEDLSGSAHLGGTSTAKDEVYFSGLWQSDLVAIEQPYRITHTNAATPAIATDDVYIFLIVKLGGVKVYD